MSNNNTIKKLLTFSTVNSNNRSTSNPSFYLLQPITNLLNYSVVNFSGINNYYNINSNNQNFAFQETGKAIITLQIPIGQYTVTTLISKLQTLMNLNSPYPNTYVISLNNNYIDINASGTAVTWKFIDISNSLYYTIGFYPSLPSAAFHQYASQQVDLSGISTLFIGSASFGENAAIINSQLPVIASVAITGSYLSPIIYDAKFPTQVTVENNMINIISFSLFDQRLQAINFTSDWSITILVECN